jgi:hypothetical protein
VGLKDDLSSEIVDVVIVGNIINFTWSRRDEERTNRAKKIN